MGEDDDLVDEGRYARDDLGIRRIVLRDSELPDGWRWEDEPQEDEEPTPPKRKGKRNGMASA